MRSTKGSMGTVRMVGKVRDSMRKLMTKGSKRPGMSGVHTGKGHVMTHGTYRKEGMHK